MSKRLLVLADPETCAESPFQQLRAAAKALAPGDLIRVQARAADLAFLVRAVTSRLGLRIVAEATNKSGAVFTLQRPTTQKVSPP